MVVMVLLMVLITDLYHFFDCGLFVALTAQTKKPLLLTAALKLIG